MNIREFAKPVTAAALNESLAKRFGTKININAFTLEQLQDARNKLRTKLSQVETNESYDTVHKNEGYQKSKLFLDVLNAAISEREDIDEGKKKKKDWNKDGKHDWEDVKAARMAASAKAAGKKKMNDSIVREGKEDEAELVMAAKDMVDRVTGWMEDTAEMQTESMLELADAIRDELGQEQSDQFVATVKPALESLYTTMETTRGSLTSGVAMLTGEGAPEPMGAEGEEELPDMGEPGAEPEMEPTVDQEDEFGAAEAAAGGEEEAGREKRESRFYYNKRSIIENSGRIAAILSKKKTN